MNILLIGNGFDLAHGLPTTYNDFLNFVNIILSFPICNKPIYDCTHPKAYSKINEDIIKILYDKISLLVKEDFSEYKIYLGYWNYLLKDNLWIKYFQSNKSNIGDNWIDFEKEISIVIKALETLIKENKIINGCVFYSDLKKYKSRDLTMFIDCYDEVEEIVNIEFDYLKKQLQDDLDKLIIALEAYLRQYVERIYIKRPLQDIISADIDVVISFNYTDTFTKVYKKEFDIPIDFIHGRAEPFNYNMNLSNNIVLGINDYLEDDENENNTDFISFKKYYQIIDKDIVHKYKNWFEVKSKNSKTSKAHHLYIFGHSLDITDKDILKEIISRDDVTTTIFYHKDETRKKLIANLQKIIGKKELIKRTNNPNKTIEFQKQFAVWDKPILGNVTYDEDSKKIILEQF